MLNLVQVQEQLKGLPMDAIMQYASGGNPAVPPYVALAELNRRKDMQAAAPMPQNPEQQPTVADQVKQAIMAPMQQMQPPMQGADPAQAGVAGLQPQNGFEQPQSGVASFADGGYTGYVQDKPVERNKFEEEADSNPLLKLIKKLIEYKAEPIQQGPPDMTQADRVVESYGEGTKPEYVTPPMPSAAPQGPGAPASGMPTSGVAGLPSAKLRTGPPSAAPTDYQSQYREAMGRIAGGINPATSDEELAAQIAKMNVMFGIKEPGQERDGRINAMEQILRERAETFKRQQGERGFDNKLEMVRAYAQANPYQRYGSMAGAYGQLKEKDNAADIAEIDKRMELTAKLDELRALNEAAQQAFRQGNLAQYTALRNKQEETKMKVAELQAQTEGTVYKQESTNQNQRQVHQMDNESRERVAATAAAARAAGRLQPKTSQEMAVYQRAAADVDRAINSGPMKMQFMLMAPEEQEDARERLIQKRFAEIKAATGASPTMPGAAPAQTGGGQVVDFSSLK
jgi:hypothetical protein